MQPSLIHREIENFCTKTTKYRKQCSKEFSHIQNYDYTVFCIASGALDISTRAIYVDIKYMWWNNLERFTIWSYSNNQNRKKSRRRRRRKQNKTNQKTKNKKTDQWNLKFILSPRILLIWTLCMKHSIFYFLPSLNVNGVIWNSTFLGGFTISATEATDIPSNTLQFIQLPI